METIAELNNAVLGPFTLKTPSKKKKFNRLDLTATTMLDNPPASGVYICYQHLAGREQC